MWKVFCSLRSVTKRACFALSLLLRNRLARRARRFFVSAPSFFGHQKVCVGSSADNLRQLCKYKNLNLSALLFTADIFVHCNNLRRM